MDYSEDDKALETRQAVEAAYKLHREQLLTFIRASVSNASVVEDIMQDVFLEALKKYKNFIEHPNQIGWLYNAAKYKIMEFSRKVQSVELIDIDDETVEIGQEESGYVEAELELYVEKSLTSEEFLLYCRYFRWGWTMERIAEAEGITENNVRVKLSRIKKKLMEQRKTDF